MHFRATSLSLLTFLCFCFLLLHELLIYWVHRWLISGKKKQRKQQFLNTKVTFGEYEEHWQWQFRVKWHIQQKFRYVNSGKLEIIQKCTLNHKNLNFDFCVISKWISKYNLLKLVAYLYYCTLDYQITKFSLYYHQ